MIGRPAKAKIDVRVADGVAIAAIEGDMDLHVSHDLREQLMRVVNENPAMVADLARVTGIDSSGVATLLEVFQRATRRRKKFVVAAAGDSVLRVLRMARLETIFVMSATVDEALAAARRK